LAWRVHDGWLDRFWDEALMAFKEAAKREAGKEMKPPKTKKKGRSHEPGAAFGRNQNWRELPIADC
jgi:hypothetical protein